VPRGLGGSLRARAVAASAIRADFSTGCELSDLLPEAPNAELNCPALDVAQVELAFAHLQNSHDVAQLPFRLAHRCLLQLGLHRAELFIDVSRRSDTSRRRPLCRVRPGLEFEIGPCQEFCPAECAQAVCGAVTQSSMLVDAGSKFSVLENRLYLRSASG
jgi:hypothetical protein